MDTNEEQYDPVLDVTANGAMKLFLVLNNFLCLPYFYKVWHESNKITSLRPCCASFFCCYIWIMVVKTAHKSHADTGTIYYR